LYLVQTGQHPSSAKILKGLGSGTVELVDDFDGDTYRAVYTVRFWRRRLRSARLQEEVEAGRQDTATRYRSGEAAIKGCRARLCGAFQEGEKMMARKVKVEVGSGNIFADLGLPDADTHFLKAQIVSEIYRLTGERKLTQAQAGRLMGITQPEVSRMFKGRFREYSIDRLIGFLTSFDRDVEIVVKPHKKRGTGGRITFSSLPA
jgi:predicted XRE-type DNA-binding protein